MFFRLFKKNCFQIILNILCIWNQIQFQYVHFGWIKLYDNAEMKIHFGLKEVSIEEMNGINISTKLIFDIILMEMLYIHIITIILKNF